LELLCFSKAMQRYALFLNMQMFFEKNRKKISRTQFL